MDAPFRSIRDIKFGELGKKQKEELARMLSEIEPSFSPDDSDPLVLLHDLYVQASDDAEAEKIRQQCERIVLGMQATRSSATAKAREQETVLHRHVVHRLKEQMDSDHATSMGKSVNQRCEEFVNLLREALHPILDKKIQGRHDQTKDDRIDAFIKIGKIEMELGMVYLARMKFEFAANEAERVGNTHGDAMIMNVAEAMMEAGLINDAIQTVYRIKNDIRPIAFEAIAVKQAENGDTDGAKKTFLLGNAAMTVVAARRIENAKKMPEINIEDNGQKALEKALEGKSEEAKKLFEKAKKGIRELEDDSRGAWRLTEIAVREIKAGFFDNAENTIDEARQMGEQSHDFMRKNDLPRYLLVPSTIIFDKRLMDMIPPKDEICEYIVSQLIERKTEPVFLLGSFLERKDALEIIGKIPERMRKEAKFLMDFAYVSTYPEGMIDKQEKLAIFKEYRKDLEKFAQNPSAHPPRSLELTITLLRALGIDEVKQQFLEMARGQKYPEGKYRLLEALIEMDVLSGSDMALQIAVMDGIRPKLSRFLLGKLCKHRYLDMEMEPYLYQKEHWQYYVNAIKKMSNDLGIQPDKNSLLFFTQPKNERISDLDGRVKEIRGHIEEFGQITDKDKLVEILSKDSEKLTLYYLLYGGRTRYALVNRYDTKKLGVITKKAAELETVQGPLDEFAALLKMENKQEIIEKIKAGKWPFEGNGRFGVRLDIAHSKPLEEANKRLAEVLGKNEIGVILKYSAYLQFLEERNDELAGKFAAANGIGDLTALVDAAEKKHPEIRKLKGLDVDVRAKWKKLQEKDVLNLILEAALENEQNHVDVKGLYDGLETQRKELLVRIRQEAKSGGIDKETRGRIISSLEEKGRAKLMRYVLCEAIAGKPISENEKLEMLLSEWESHLEEPFQNYDKAMKEGRFKIEKKVVHAVVRWLDKREDMIECFRVADSAQCCFKSDNYAIGGERSAADWIARLWKDPLSFMFQIEEPAGIGKVHAIGFVFGTFGIVDGELAVMNNGVYLKDKSPEAAESVLYTIEENFSRPIGAGWQVAASRHGGSTKMPSDYDNKKFKAKRLRAIGRFGRPETEVYDDLSIGCNQEKETSELVWRKRLSQNN